MAESSSNTLLGCGHYYYGHFRSSAGRCTALEPYIDSALRHKLLGLWHGMFAEVEDTGRKYRISLPLNDSIYQMLQSTDPTRGSNWHLNRITNAPSLSHL